MLLSERRRLPEPIVAGRAGVIRMSEEVDANGEEFFRIACEHGDEGIVAKRRDDYGRASRPHHHDFWRGVWCWIESKVKVAEDKADKAASDLALHKLHTAEYYVSKQGLRETTEQLMAAIGAVKGSVDNMTLRVDRIVENQTQKRTTRAG
ncbi:hypothetical protein EV184_12585 [Sinorhizobium americanum]|uniref:Uncharacterized protein n=1 Tax=Sinorhizobium americanum TaxID=194963 RepID=A0A4V2RCT2_9HYPH|nr:hypothetical protein EV184_12585 [Sinorhizobium americanum]